MTGLILLAEQFLPRMDGMYWLMLASRVLHILSAIVLVGGLFYLRAVITPALSRLPQRGSKDQATDSTATDALFGGRRAAWAMWVGLASLLLLATGLFNFLQIVRMHERLGPVYHSVAGLKILTGLALFILAAILAGNSPSAQAMQRNWRAWLNLCLAIGILTAVLGSFMRSFDHIRKANPQVPSVEAAP